MAIIQKKKDNVIKNVKTLHTSIKRDRYDKTSEERVIENLKISLASKLARSDFVEIIRTYDAYFSEEIYTARIRVVDENFDNVMTSDNDGVYIGENRFSRQEIKNAIYNTYPERFL